MTYKGDWRNFLLSEEEIESVAHKMEELDPLPVREHPLPHEEGLHGWAIVGIKEMLAAMKALGYVVLKTQAVTITPLDAPAVPSNPPSVSVRDWERLNRGEVAAVPAPTEGEK
jgi:hypothetical protein